MVESPGLEPGTHALKGRYSTNLSYDSNLKNKISLFKLRPTFYIIYSKVLTPCLNKQFSNVLGIKKFCCDFS